MGRRRTNHACSSSRRRPRSATAPSPPACRPSASWARPTLRGRRDRGRGRVHAARTSPATTRSCGSRPPATCSTPPQQAAFEHYIQAGGGYAGVHAASDTEYTWNWYGGLVGAYFGGHPDPQTATVKSPTTRTPRPSTCRPAGRARTSGTTSNPTRAGRSTCSPRWTRRRTPAAGWAPTTRSPGASYYQGGRSWYTGGGHADASFTDAAVPQAPARRHPVGRGRAGQRLRRHRQQQLPEGRARRQRREPDGPGRRARRPRDLHRARRPGARDRPGHRPPRRRR